MLGKNKLLTDFFITNFVTDFTRYDYVHPNRYCPASSIT